MHRNRARFSIRCSMLFATCTPRDWCSGRSMRITSLRLATGSSFHRHAARRRHLHRVPRRRALAGRTLAAGPDAGLAEELADCRVVRRIRIRSPVGRWRKSALPWTRRLRPWRRLRGPGCRDPPVAPFALRFPYRGGGRKEAPAPERAATHPFPKWVFVGAAGVLLLVLGLNRRRPAEAVAPSPVAAVSLPAETPAPAPLPKAAIPESVVSTVPKASPACRQGNVAGDRVHLPNAQRCRQESATAQSVSPGPERRRVFT